MPFQKNLAKRCYAAVLNTNWFSTFFNRKMHIAIECLRTPDYLCEKNSKKELVQTAALQETSKEINLFSRTSAIQYLKAGMVCNIRLIATSQVGIAVTYIKKMHTHHFPSWLAVEQIFGHPLCFPWSLLQYSLQMLLSALTTECMLCKVGLEATRQHGAASVSWYVACPAAAALATMLSSVISNVMEGLKETFSD